MSAHRVQGLAGFLLVVWLGGFTPRVLAQEKAGDEVRNEIEKAGKSLSEKILGIISRQEERIGALERKVSEKDREIAELKKKVEDLAGKEKTRPAEPKPEAEKPKGTPILGVSPAEVDEETRAKLNLREGQGTKIMTVQPGSPADKAGIKPGDIILSLGGKDASGTKLRDLVQTFAPSEKVEVVFLRGAEKITRTAELVDRDQFLSQVVPMREAEPPAKPQPAAPSGPVVLGLLVGETDAGPEVQNVEPGKTGAAAQLKEGDIILALNGKKVKDLDEIGEALGKAKAGEELAIDYKRKDGEFRAKVVAAGERGEPKFLSVAPLKDKPAEPAKTPEIPIAPKGPATLGVQVLEEDGVKVVEVRPGGAAAAAGIRQGDVLVEVDKKPIRGIEDLRGILKGKSAGDVIAVTVARGGEKKVIENVKLGAAGKESAEAKPPEAKEKKPEPSAKKPRGVLGITAIEAEDHGLVVSVVNEKGPADKAGVRKDDNILKVNGTEVRKFDDLERALKESSAGDKLRLTIKRGEETKEIEIVLGSPETSSLFPSRRVAPASGPSDGEGGGPVYLGVALLEEAAAAGNDAARHEARVAIHEIYEGGPAELAGLHAGDEVLSVDGRPVRTLDDIGCAVTGRSPGETVRVQVSRAGETIDAGLVLGGGR